MQLLLLSLLPLASAIAQAPAPAPAKAPAKSGGQGQLNLGALAGLLGGGGKGGQLPDLGALLGGASSALNGDIIDSICKTSQSTDLISKGIWSMLGNPSGSGGPEEKCQRDESGGSGPYNANYTEDASLPNHTIYAPKNPPVLEKLPVIIWANGACIAAGRMFANFLNEIASHGFLVIANGRQNGTLITGMTNYREVIKSVDWVMNNPAAKKYGQLDTSKLVAAGQSCGGLEAMEATLNDERIKLTVLFNSGYTTPSTPEKMAKFKNPIAYFPGGKSDGAQRNSDTDYKNLPSNVPSVKASVDTGHMGSYYHLHGGKMGKAAVAFFKWQLKGDVSQKALFCGAKADSVLIKAGFTIESKNGMC